MWLFKYLVCLRRSHIFTDIIWQDLPYQYCLRCGRVELQGAVTERINVGGQR